MLMSTQNDSQSEINNTESNLTQNDGDVTCSDPQNLTQDKDGSQVIQPDAERCLQPPPPPPQEPFRFPLQLSEGITLTVTELKIIKLTAQFVAVYGKSFEHKLREVVFTKPRLQFMESQLQFMKDNHSSYSFYCGISRGYSSALGQLEMPSRETVTFLRGFFNLVRQALETKEEEVAGVEMARIDFHAFHFFVNMSVYSWPVPPPGSLSNPQMKAPLGSLDIQPDAEVDAEFYLQPPPPLEDTIYGFPSLPGGITLTELNIIKLTAHFASVFGRPFVMELKNSVLMYPQLAFLNSSDSRFDLYNKIRCGYWCLFTHFSKLNPPWGSSTVMPIKCFFELLPQVLQKKEEDVLEMAMIDLPAFECFVNAMLNYKFQLPADILSLIKNQPPQMSTQNDLQSGLNNTESKSIVERRSDPYQQKLTQNEDGSQVIQPDAERYLQPPPPPPQEPFRFPLQLSEGITLTVTELKIIKLTAQFVAVYGKSFEHKLREVVFTKPRLQFMESQLQFMKDNHSSYSFYCGLSRGYSSALGQLEMPSRETVTFLRGFFNLVRQALETKEEEVVGVEMARIDFHAFHFFVNMSVYSWPVPPPGSLSNPQMKAPLGSLDIQPDAEADAEFYLQPPPPLEDTIYGFPSLPGGITLTELNIIKLTAHFASVFGRPFVMELKNSVLMYPQLAFLNSSDSRFDLYNKIRCGYWCLFTHFSKLNPPWGSSTVMPIKCFFELLPQVLQKKEEDVLEMAMIDLPAFECFVNAMLNYKFQLPADILSLIKNQPPQMSTQNDLQSGLNNTESKSIVERRSDPYQQKLTQNEDGSQVIQPDAERYLQPPPPPPQEPFRFPLQLSEGITLTVTELKIIKLTAQFVAVYGKSFEHKLREVVFTKPRLQFMESQLQFMKDNHSSYSFYCGLSRGYSSALGQLEMPSRETVTFLRGFFNLVRQALETKEEEVVGVEMARIDFHAFHFFVNMSVYSWPVPPPGSLSNPQMKAPLGSLDIQPDAEADAEFYLQPPPPLEDTIYGFPSLPGGITLTELNIIKLTAQFASVFGRPFVMELKNSVLMYPQLAFLNSSDSRFDLYNKIRCGYWCLFTHFSKLNPPWGSSTVMPIKCFFELLPQVLQKKEEDLLEMAMIDLPAFECFVNAMLNYKYQLPADILSLIKNQPPQRQPPLGSR